MYDKDNFSKMVLFCDAEKQNNCIYFKDEFGVCKYYKDGQCNSMIAKVNRCMLFLKATGVLTKDKTEAEQ